MYCATCRRERLGTARVCVVCGGVLGTRSEELVRRELEHVQYVLEDLRSWDPEMVGERAARWIRVRYERNERILMEVLGLVPDAPVQVEQPAPQPAPSPEPRRVDAAPIVEEPAPVEPEPPAPAVAQEPPKVSRWATVWRPFLYESIGWFLGGFLILAGAFYFVAESWSSIVTRALVVFALSAAYAIGFAAWGAFLRRREALLGAGRVIGTIGAAVSPLPALALGPLLASNPLVFWILALLWASAATWLIGPIARSLDARSERAMQALVLATSITLATAPVMAGLGSPAVWLNLLPVALFAVSARAGAGESRTGAGLAFVVLAPLYLMTLFAVRLHLALAAAQVLPPLATYAPLLSLALAASLQLRRVDHARAASPFEVAVIAAQVACLIASTQGAVAPSFFVSSFALAHTAFRLSRAASHESVAQVRARWLYLTYFAGQFAYQTCGQLIPGVLADLIVMVKAALGYGEADPFPFNFGAVYALGYFAGGAVLVVIIRARAVREVLLRSTAVLAVLATALAFAGSDLRAGWWSVAPFAAGCLALGIGFNRAYLTRVGAALALLVPVFATGVGGLALGAWAAAVIASVLALLSVPALRPHRLPLSLVAFVLAGATVGAAVLDLSLTTSVATAVAGAAALLVARNLDDRRLLALAVVIASASVAIATPQALQPLVIACTAVALSALALLPGRFATALPAAVLWALAAVALGFPAVDPVVLALAAVSLFVGGLRFSPLHALSAIATFAFLLPASGFVQPMEAMLGFGALALASAVASGTRWKVATISFGLCGVVGAATVSVMSLDATFALAAAVIALTATRALHPTFTFVVAGLFATAAAGSSSSDAVVLVAAALTALALLDDAPALRALLLGTRSVRRAGAVVACFAAVSATAAAHLHEPLTLISVIALGALPFAWARTNWVSGFAPPLLVALAAGAWVNPLPVLIALPVAVVLITRALGKRCDARFAGALTASLAFVGAMVLYLRPQWSFLAPLFAAAMLFVRAPASWLRIAVGAMFAAVFAPANVPAVLALWAVGFLSHHWPRVAAGALGDDEPLRLDVVAISGVVLAMVGIAQGGTTWVLAGSLAVAALLLRAPRLLILAVLACAAAHLTLGELSQLHLASVSLVSAVVALLLRLESARDFVERWISRLTPTRGADWAQQFWIASAIATGAALALNTVTSHATNAVPFLALISALVLLVSRSERAAAVASLLAAGAAVLLVPPEWRAAAGALSGLLLCASVTLRDDASRARHHAGWVIAFAALALLRELDHPATPIAAALAATSLWLVARRNRSAELWAWLATAAAAHVVLFYLGLELGTGKPKTLILPYLGAACAIISAIAWRRHRPVAIAILALAVLELCAGIVLVEGVATRESWVAAAGLVIALWSLARSAIQESDEMAGFWAMALLLLGYVVVRTHGVATPPGAGDSVAALVAGAVLLGLYRWADREGWIALRRPLLASAYLFPLAGLIAAPWSAPTASAALLVGLAAHFSVLARAGGPRKLAAVLAFVSFNAALACGWLGTGAFGPEYFVIPGALAALLLLRVFEPELSPDAAARVRAFAITIVYAAAAFRPLMFEHGAAMVFCVFVCVAGVAAGVAFKIRSYVYLGSGFMVTAVLANLVRFGVRDHRVGAIFLSALGLMIITFMVLLSAHRAKLLERYDQLRRSLENWSG